MHIRSCLARAAVITTVTVLVSSTGIAGAARATPDKETPLSDDVHAAGATPEILALMRDQVALDMAADQIERLPGGAANSGLGGFIVDPANKTLNVYWKGAVPPALRREQLAAASKSMVISIRSAAYTLAELETERDRLAKVHITNATAGTRVVSIGPKADGSGLEVGVAGVSGEHPQQALRQITPALSSKIPLDTVPTEAAMPTARLGDTNPYWGGAYMERPSHGNACSTGFPLWTSYAPQSRVMLTAAHCGQGHWYNGTGTGLNNFMGGTFPDEDRAHDAMIVAMPSEGRIYDGGSIQGEAAQFSKPVRGQFGNRTGDYICTSGAFSGATCGIRVAATGQTITMTNFGTVRNMVRAEKDDRTAAVGNGDSGGPAFSLTADATGVYARGTISAISSVQADWRACRGVPSGPNSDPRARHCSWKFWYPDVLVQLQGLTAAAGDRSFRILRYGE